eukprot:TRINITY_DN10326_c0_g1_i2.p1 TRINITY_DN10326_c0_g1~~TRINITY_DN10326_c0_g1_i2.p1  ORF type:complete len:191 (+),score=40.49 TRINITY_DN10326_c0_g1_i2:45-617(+)
MFHCRAIQGIFLIFYLFFFFNDTATTEIYTLHIVGSVRCVQETVSTQSTWVLCFVIIYIIQFNFFFFFSKLIKYEQCSFIYLYIYLYTHIWNREAMNIGNLAFKQQELQAVSQLCDTLESNKTAKIKIVDTSNPQQNQQYYQTQAISIVVSVGGEMVHNSESSRQQLLKGRSGHNIGCLLYTSPSPRDQA